MAKFAKQFAIIDKIKNLVKKTGNTIFRTRDEFNISEDVARKIQKTAYDLSHQSIKDSKTSTYLELANQLQVDEDQIFRAAAFYMTNIAKNEKRNAVKIIAILEENIKDSKRDKENIDYVNKKIQEIKNYHHI